VFPVRYELNLFDIFGLQNNYVKCVEQSNSQIGFAYLKGGLLARSQCVHPEGPATGQLYRGFPDFPLFSRKC
jgi:hypothetical protein